MVWVMHTDHTCEHMSTRNSRPQFCPTLFKRFFFHMSVRRSAVILYCHALLQIFLCQGRQFTLLLLSGSVDNVKNKGAKY